MMLTDDITTHFHTINNQIDSIQPQFFTLATAAKQLRLMVTTILCCVVRMPNDSGQSLRVVTQDMQTMGKTLLSNQHRAESLLEQLKTTCEYASVSDEYANTVVQFPTSMKKTVHELQQILATLALVAKQGDYLATLIALEAKKERAMSPRLSRVSCQLEQLMVTLEKDIHLLIPMCDTLSYHLNALNRIFQRSVMLA